MSFEFSNQNTSFMKNQVKMFAVASTEVQCSNGIIHVLDKVLVP